MRKLSRRSKSNGKIGVAKGIGLAVYFVAFFIFSVPILESASLPSEAYQLERSRAASKIDTPEAPWLIPIWRFDQLPWRLALTIGVAPLYLTLVTYVPFAILVGSPKLAALVTLASLSVGSLLVIAFVFGVHGTLLIYLGLAGGAFLPILLGRLIYHYNQEWLDRLMGEAGS